MRQRRRRARLLAGAVLLTLGLLGGAGCGDREVVVAPTSLPVPATTSSPATSSSPGTTGEAAGSTMVDASTSSTDNTATSTTEAVDTTYDPYAGAQPAETAGGAAVEGELRTADGRIRAYRVYVPSGLTADTAAPLLIALHGGGGSAAQFELNSGFDGLAESNGFIVVYPDGISALPGGTGPQTWNGGYCCGPAVTRDVDDVEFIRQLVDTLGARYRLDPTRIFAAGHSNGAIFSYRLACELGDVIAAIGVQAGSLGIDSCTPSQPVSVLHLHGTADTNHPIDGGRGSGIAGVDFRDARSSVEALATADGCAPTPTTATTPDHPDLTAITWQGCSRGTEVRYVIVAGATHAWMGHPGVSAAASAYVGEPYPNLDASRAIWAFLTAHPRS